MKEFLGQEIIRVRPVARSYGDRSYMTIPVTLVRVEENQIEIAYSGRSVLLNKDWMNPSEWERAKPLYSDLVKSLVAAEGQFNSHNYNGAKATIDAILKKIRGADKTV